VYGYQQNGYINIYWRLKQYKCRCAELCIRLMNFSSSSWTMITKLSSNSPRNQWIRAYDWMAKSVTWSILIQQRTCWRPEQMKIDLTHLFFLPDFSGGRDMFKKKKNCYNGKLLGMSMGFWDCWCLERKRQDGWMLQINLYTHGNVLRYTNTCTSFVLDTNNRIGLIPTHRSRFTARHTAHKLGVVAVLVSACRWVLNVGTNACRLCSRSVWMRGRRKWGRKEDQTEKRHR